MNKYISGLVILLAVLCGVLTAHAKNTEHTVSSGETLSAIAQSYQVSMRDLKKLNNKKTNTILIGEVLVLPKIIP